MNRQQLLRRIGGAWSAFNESYAGLPDARLEEPGAVGDWSVKDVLAHVTTWEEETLKYLLVIAVGGRTPRYASQGGIDAFNARVSEEKRSLSLAEVRRQLDETHHRLIVSSSTSRARRKTSLLRRHASGAACGMTRTATTRGTLRRFVSGASG